VSFEQFGFDPRIAAGISSAGYSTPTPIQELAIPAVLAGRDVLGLAQTGTGKTAAFVLPILQRLIGRPHGKVRALVLSPTRELAEQTKDEVVALGAKTRTRCATVYGGVGMAPQVKKLKAGVDIVVACPGRLLDHLRQGTVDLSGVEVLVIDEADRMFDMGFMPDVRRILESVPSKRQTLLFSATMPEDIRRFTRHIMHNPVDVQVNPCRPAETVSHALYPVEEHLKTPLLIGLLKKAEVESVLVFTRTRHRTKRLADKLKGEGFSVARLEGGMPQGKRQDAMDGFRRGRYRILVATDIAARGVDVTGISHVINYDVPDTSDSYTHRIGRTGRAERTGTAFTLVTPADVSAVRTFAREMPVELVQCELEGFDYGPRTRMLDIAPPRPRPYGRLQRTPARRGFRR
jgi:ATP-dependent RNA helicase RhlE